LEKKQLNILKIKIKIKIKIKTKYNEFSGVFVWEYFKAPSLTGNPEDWCVDIYNNTK